MSKSVPIELQFDDDGPLYVAQKKVYPQSVSGTFRRIKWGLMAFCLGVYYLLPFVRWNRGLGAPDQAVLIDLPNSRFYFFFIELWPQEVYYFTGLLIVAALILLRIPLLGTSTADSFGGGTAVGTLTLLLIVGVALALGAGRLRQGRPSDSA